jgi:hypothetical protein
MVKVLCLNSAGVPHRWSSIEDAAIYAAKGLVLWEHGTRLVRLHGGINASSGERSVLDVPPIMALRGEAFFDGTWDAPTISRALVFQRDRSTCAYCVRVFPESELTVDHIVPVARGGKSTWMNLVTADKRCNSFKADRLPHECGLELAYLPYVPNKHESLILTNRRIVADQMAWLATGLPKHSRLRPQ